ncbi:class I SAM-dependent methyltransferase [Pseudorhizobium endolithicum]|uniref:Class I SAM-dependent methyltransferase n=1 Tax=Pseudorhizobium endolithicum TaxID=1191678 RepID=A0ABM8PCE2_9HYPH|nr:class I SAM-dependent methyltransferase [Pseudorhizobium endolithicum]CAD7023076.1 class I SAM-dependent methyltransferase [Pseudorhizobium endolithicum]
METYSRRLARKAIEGLARTGLWKESEQALIRSASSYWEDPTANHFATNSHWCRDVGIESTVWNQLGKPHLAILQRHMKAIGKECERERILEWGCGGGANAIHFASSAKEFVGADVSRASLAECKSQLEQRGHANFSLIHIDIAEPEQAVRHLLGTCDVFLCTYVFELLPSPEYGTRVLKLAYELLQPGGCAIIQIKYQTHDRRTQPRRWLYQRNLANMTTYPIDEFWQIASRVGFSPAFVTLLPKDLLVEDERYAYFVLDKRG